MVEVYMSFWDGLSSTVSDAYSSTLDSAGDWYGNYLGELTSEPEPTTAATGAGSVPVNVSPGPDQSGGFLSGMNWQMIGGIVAVIALLLTLFRGK